MQAECVKWGCQGDQRCGYCSKVYGRPAAAPTGATYHHEFEMGEGALCWFKDATIRYRCGRIADDPVHHTAAAPTEQATQPAEVCEHRDITWEDGVLVCGDCEQPVPETAAGGYQTSAGDAATDVDSTAEAAKRYPLLEANLAADLAAYVDKQNAAQVDRTALREQGPLQPGRREDNVSAGSPVTAGVPDTAALRDWLSRGSDAWVVGSLRNRVGDLLAALDAARGELVTARGERDALRAQRDHAQEQVAVWNRLAIKNGIAHTLAEARIAAALAVISGYDDIRDTCPSKADGRQCLLCDLRDALDVPAAGDAGGTVAPGPGKRERNE